MCIPLVLDSHSWASIGLAYVPYSQAIAAVIPRGKGWYGVAPHYRPFVYRAEAGT